MDRGCSVRIYIVEKPLALGGGECSLWQEHNSNSYVLLSVEFSLYVSPVVTTEKQSCVKTLHWYTVLAYLWIKSNFQQFLNLKKTNTAQF